MSKITKARVDGSIAIAIGGITPHTREVAGIRHVEIGGRKAGAPIHLHLFCKPMVSKMSQELLASGGNLILGDFTLQHSVTQLRALRREAHKDAGSRISNYRNAPHIKTNDVGSESHSRLSCHRTLRS